MIGVATVGNATLIAYDGRPVLATDPWLGDVHSAYFGSWVLSHAIPEPQRSDLFAAEYVWFSHGHPDHLNPESAPMFKHSRVLVPDHVGGRIAADLRAGGFDVQIVPDRRWVQLSQNVRIYCITVVSQDAILLVDVNGRIFVNLNDVMFKGDFSHIRRIVRDYDDSYLLKLSGRGDSDMKNLYTEAGEFIAPDIDTLVGRQLSTCASALGINHVIPFSSFHQYQRADSMWASPYVTPIEAYREGFDDRRAEYIEPFVFVDCESGEVVPLRPDAIDIVERPPEDFGDNWSDELDTDDRALITDYFQVIEGLDSHLGFITFRVGGREHRVPLGGSSKRGITFEAPRGSLMAAVRYEIFDDLLIGNFMKTTLHGISSLYSPNVGALIAKYADNGHARANDEVARYLAEYRSRVGVVPWYLGIAGARGAARLRVLVPKGGRVFNGVRKTYYFIRRAA